MTSEAKIVLLPRTVRTEIREQHAGLRLLLHDPLDATTRSLRHDGPSRAELAERVRGLAARFRGHLAFEERQLVPVLAQLDAWGVDRVRDLFAEHIRQRAEVDTLLEGVDGEWDADRVALALRSLAADLLMDMEGEERAWQLHGSLPVVSSDANVWVAPGSRERTRSDS